LRKKREAQILKFRLIIILQKGDYGWTRRSKKFLDASDPIELHLSSS